MKQQDAIRQHTTATHGSRRGALRPSAQLITDAVVANYIHDISVRRRGASGSPDRSRGATHARSLRRDLEALARS